MPLLAGLGLLTFGISQARHLHIGDLGKGVPELRANSRYNQDVAMITSHFAIGVDLLQVIAEAKAQSEDDSPCVDRAVMRLPVRTPAWAVQAAPYAIGTIAMYWVIERVAAFWV